MKYRYTHTIVSKDRFRQEANELNQTGSEPFKEIPHQVSPSNQKFSYKYCNSYDNGGTKNGGKEWDNGTRKCNRCSQNRSDGNGSLNHIREKLPSGLYNTPDIL